MSRRGWSSLGLLVLILLIAAALRFYRLDSQDIWGDEAFSISLSSGSLARVIAGGADTHPPLYPLLLYFWLRLAGHMAFATRALSALIGMLAVPLVYVLARRMARSSSRFALTASLLTAISPLLVYYGQETRMYELVTVLSLASTYFALAFLDFRDSKRRNLSAIGYVLSTIAAAYTHYSAFFVIVAQDLIFVLLWLRHLRKTDSRITIPWLSAQALVALAYVPWILAQTGFLSGKANARYDEWSWQGLEMIFGKTLLAFSGGLTLDSPVVQVAGAGSLVLIALGALSTRSFRRYSWQAPLILIVPVAIAWLVNPIMPFFYERYVLVALPAFYLTIALGLEFVARYSRSASLAITVLLVMTGELALSQYYFNDAYAKGKYGKMMAYVSGQAQPGDALILNNPLQKPLFDYYGPKNIPAFYLPDSAPLEDPATRRELADISSSYSRLWLVMFGNPKEYDPTGYLERWLGANAYKSLARGYVDASLSLYVMPDSSVNVVHRSSTALWGNSIELTGYDIDSSRQTPGGVLRIALYWRAAGRVAKSLTVFTHLIGDWNPSTNSPVWAQMDGVPGGGSRPTDQWQVGETVDDHYGLAIPANIPPGQYTIEIGMYDPSTLARIPLVDDSGVPLPDDRLILDTVEIK